MFRRGYATRILLTAGSAAVLCLTLAAASAAQRESLRYPYGGPQFTRFVADSYRHGRAGDPHRFYRWMDDALRRGRHVLTPAPTEGWRAWLQREQQRLARISDPADKSREETALAARLHQTIKTLIPRFDLDRGFEFTNVVTRGERQCFLQSVLLAGLLQSMEVEAGVAMVYRNIQGQISNNGHAITLLKLPDGTDRIVDASDPEPLARQQGLFALDARTGGYRYLDPIYQGASPVIVAYRPPGKAAPSSKPRALPAARTDGVAGCPGEGRGLTSPNKLPSSQLGAWSLEPGARSVATRDVRGLDIPFLRSQFDYYRGERTPGGPFASKSTPKGLALAARHLRSSTRACPRNPLAVYMLGRVYLKQGNTPAAQRQFQSASRLYAAGGWLPPGLIEALTLVHLPPPAAVPGPTGSPSEPGTGSRALGTER